jgi:hypothetical protein
MTENNSPKLPSLPRTPRKQFMQSTLNACPDAPKKGPRPVCNFFGTLAGCSKGDVCRFRHVPTQLSIIPPLPCKYVLTEGGCTNFKCGYYHSEGYIHRCFYKEKCTNVNCNLLHPSGYTPSHVKIDPSTILCKAETKFMKLQGVGCSLSKNPKCQFLHKEERSV